MAIQDSHNTGDDNAAAIYGTYWEGQTFTAGATYTVTSVKAKIYRVGSPGNCTLRIRATAGDLPTGDDLATGVVDCDAITADSGGEWVEFDLGAGTELTASTVYAITLNGGTNASNRISWRYETTGTYGGGRRCSSSTSGSSWGGYTQDHMFETYSSATYSELSGDCAGAGAGSGDLELNTYSALAGTCAAVGDGSGDLGSTLVYTSGYVTYRRLIAAGNNQIWYEDI